jgi:hypothetical protein
MKITIDLQDSNFKHLESADFEVSESYYGLIEEAVNAEAEQKIKEYNKKGLKAEFYGEIKICHRIGNDFVDLYLPCKVYENDKILQEFNYRLTAFPLENEYYEMRKILTSRV